MRKNLSHVAVIKLNLSHAHNTNVADSYKYLRITKETREEFEQYFKDAMTPSEAMTLHKEKLGMEEDAYLKLADGSVNPCANTVYHIHRMHRKNNFGTIDPIEKIKEKLQYYKELGKL